MPRTSTQFQQMKDERRAQILVAARRVFADKGLAATKIADIAAAAGVSHGLVYHYFLSKEAVFVAIVTYAAESIAALTGAALERPGTPWDRLSFLCEIMLRGMREQPEYAVVMRQADATAALDQETLTVYLESLRQSYANTRTLIRAGQRAGEVVAGDADELTTTFFALINGLAMTGRRLNTAGAFPSVDTVLRLLKA